MTTYAILQDTSLCMECQGCRVACQMQNQLPPEDVFIRFEFRDKGTYPNVTHQISRKTCLHCKDAACVVHCPTGASYKGESGLTHHDPKYCGGCGACAVECPFGVPVIKHSVALRCSGCESLTENGKPPVCVATCVANALSFGTREEMLKKAEARVKAISHQYPNARVYSPAGVRGTGMIWVLRDSPEVYGLPTNPSVPEGLQPFVHPIGARTQIGAAAGMLLGAVGWVIARREQLKDEDK